jgi:hypothetical protein
MLYERLLHVGIDSIKSREKQRDILSEVARIWGAKIFKGVTHRGFVFIRTQ